jgi:sterol desaturase/sphingolipid hydroxylase (fatty acid hydroxylase superfamily)
VLDHILTFCRSLGHALWIAAQLFLISAAIFGYLTLLVKGKEAWTAARRAIGEIRLNVWIYFLDALFVGPVVGLLVFAIRFVIGHTPLTLVHESAWSLIGTYGTFIAVVFVGDLVSYFRHRLEHTRLLWPSHAIHHSDTDMSWLTLARFHPINRFTTAAIDIVALAMLGFPAWALVANEIVRHYYGEFIHADLPWTYGPLGRIFVSPVMHRWHHARDVVGAGSNFATVFSVFDQAFGTYYVPGICKVPLGVVDEIGPGLWAQLRYPIVEWYQRFRNWRHQRFSTRAILKDTGPSNQIARS